MKMRIAEIEKGPTLSHAVADLLPAGLTILGIVGAYVVAWFSRMPIPIENPILLAIAASVLLLPSNGHTLQVLQKMVGVYLAAMPFNEIYPQYVTIPLTSKGLLVSYSVGPFLLCAVGSLLMRRRQPGAPESPGGSALRVAWPAALGILIVHMIVLAALFHATYGYGCEHDLHVLAHISLYFLLFLILWTPLDRRGLRIFIAPAIGAFYLLLAFKR